MALNLKSASGAGYTFEDEVAALLLAEMLVGHKSLGKVDQPIPGTITKPDKYQIDSN